MLKLALLGLATWRLSSLLVAEDGPFSMFAKMRDVAGVTRPGEISGLARLFSCVWCMSIWVGSGLFLAYRFTALLYVLAASTIAIIIQERVVNKR